MRTSPSLLATALTLFVLPTVAVGQDGLDSVTTSVEWPSCCTMFLGQSPLPFSRNSGSKYLPWPGSTL